MMPSPIVLFVYNRPWHTRQTVEALQKNPLAAQSDLFIYSDGPKKFDQTENVREVREYIRTVTGFLSVSVIERDDNLGLANSIITGVTEIVNRFGRIIVLEDDMVTSPYFLRYMNEALDKYEKEERVISIHAYTYPVKGALPETFFLRGADCWGWATWKRGWSLFEPDGNKLLAKIHKKNLQQLFDYNGSYRFTKMLKDQIAGLNDSWAIRWYASAFLNERLTLYPGRSLVQNIGTDQSGSHCGNTNVFVSDAAITPVVITPISIEEISKVRKTFESYFRSISPSFIRKILQCLK
jgi:hypothetical protein